MKKTVIGGALAGVVSVIVLVTGCGGKKVQVAPVAGSGGLLGTRGSVPPPLSSPASIKAVPIGASSADGTGAAPAAAGSEVVLPEPTLGGESRMTGSAPLVSVVPAEPAITPVAQGGAFVPAPETPIATADAPLIQDLSAGQAIPAPVAPASVASAPAAATQTYVVKKGDSLATIARKYGTTWQAIAVLNNITDAKKLQIGQTLTLPDGAVAPAAPAAGSAAKAVAAAPAKPFQVKTAPKAAAPKAAAPKATKKASAKPLPPDGKYTVKSGDSLWKIAHKYGLSSEQIRTDNNLKSDMLRPGQVLVLKATVAKKAEPAKADGPVKTAKDANAAPVGGAKPGLSSDKYVVKSGDSLWIIARRYKCTVENLIEWNALKTTNLRLGQVLIVKKDGTDAAPEAPVPVVDQGGVQAPAAQVQVGIDPAPAPQAATPAVVDIKAQTLPTAIENAPVAAPTTVTYTVQQGDTLTDILRKNMMSPEQFKELNPWYMEGEDLKPGSEIKVIFAP